MARMTQRVAAPSPLLALALAALLVAALFGRFEPGRGSWRALPELHLFPTRREAVSVGRPSGAEAHLAWESPGASYFRQTAGFQELMRALEAAEN